MSFHVEFKLDLDNVRHLLTFELLMVNVFKLFHAFHDFTRRDVSGVIRRDLHELGTLTQRLRRPTGVGKGQIPSGSHFLSADSTSHPFQSALSVRSP